jgi:hypothetical protein
MQHFSSLKAQLLKYACEPTRLRLNVICLTLSSKYLPRSQSIVAKTKSQLDGFHYERCKTQFEETQIASMF